MNTSTWRSTGEVEDRQYAQLKTDLHHRLIEGANLAAIRNADPNEIREELRRAAEQLCSSQAALLGRADRDRLIDELVHEVLGLGPLEPLMSDPSICDILINGPSTVYVERHGRLERTAVRFQNLDHLISIVQRIAERAGRRIDEASPIVDARLEDGSRINAIMRPLALDGALVSIRKFSTHPLSAAELVSRGSATPKMLEFLASCVEGRLNLLVSGGTGSGKTTLLNMLSGYVPENQRIVTIEDAAELRLQQPHVARMETRPPNLEGRGEITSRDLLRNALRMRPDRIIIGECRGHEAFDMLQAMNTGHNGSMTTIHANDTREAIARLEMLIGMAAPDLPSTLIHRQIAAAINIVVQLTRLPGGGRKITQISEIVGIQGEAISMHDLFCFEQSGTDSSGAPDGRFIATGIFPHCIDRLRRVGVVLPHSMFERGVMNADRYGAI